MNAHQRRIKRRAAERGLAELTAESEKLGFIAEPVSPPAPAPETVPVPAPPVQLTRWHRFLTFLLNLLPNKTHA